MPHAGGGGGGGHGGFHSSGGSHSSVPRVNAYGHPHSSHYRGVGYYYHGTYIPLQKEGRLLSILTSFLFTAAVLVVFLVAGFFAVSEELSSSYSEDGLEDFALERYSQVYSEGASDYEEHVLVEIVLYDDGTTFDFISMIGDSVSYNVDLMFGNNTSVFGGAFIATHPEEDYYLTLYEDLATALENVNNALTNESPYRTGSIDRNEIVNNTSYILEGQQLLEDQMSTFLQKTGYAISFSIDMESDAYAPDYGSAIPTILFFGVLPLVILIITFVNMIKQIKNTRKFEESEEAQNGEEYFEGEYEYDHYFGSKSKSTTQKTSTEESHEESSEDHFDDSDFDIDSSRFDDLE